MSILNIVKPGVLTGSETKKLFAYAKENNFAIPAVNVVNTESVNALLEAAAKVKTQKSDKKNGQYKMAP